MAHVRLAFSAKDLGLKAVVEMSPARERRQTFAGVNTDTTWRRMSPCTSHAAAHPRLAQVRIANVGCGAKMEPRKEIKRRRARRRRIARMVQRLQQVTSPAEGNACRGHAG